MGKNILMALVAFTLLGGIYNAITERGLSETHERFVKHQYEAVVRNVALAGFQQATQGLSDLFSSTSYEGTYESGSYQVLVTVTGDRAEIESYGTAEDSYGDPVRHTILATVARVAEGGGAVPEFMSRPITCDGNFVTKDDFTLSNGSSNTDIHTNGNLRFESGDAFIGGFGTYKGNLELLNGQSESEIFQPYANPGGDPLTVNISEIDVPVFNASDHLSEATDVFGSDLELSGTVSMGTETNPYIWVVFGNVKTTGSVTFQGFGAILATGNFEIEHDVSTVGGSGQSSVGFYTEGNITVKNSNLTMAGQWFLNGNVEVEDNTTFAGSITNSGNCYFEKPFNMSYVEASSSLTEPIWEGDDGESVGTLQIISASEW